LDLNDRPLAEELLTEALDTTGPKDLPRINYGLALVAEQKGEVREARRLAELASEQFARLGRKGYVRECQKLLRRLPMQAVEPADHGGRGDRE
jgi:hypothetical protein